MTKFLAIINRYEFAQFYRFGYMCISASELLRFAEIDSMETKSNLVSHFKDKTPFEYDQEYLIIHLDEAVDNEKTIKKFQISDLKSIYPLSKQAKQSIQERIDTRIKLEEPIFESLIPAIISNIQNIEIEMAISALWTIFDLSGSSELIKHKIGFEHICKGIEYRKEGMKSFQLQNENIWSILMAYDRYEYFPKSTLGYFFDAGQVFAYSKQSNFENSKLFTLLKSIKEDSKTPIIISNLENSELSKSYTSNTNFDSLKFHIVAPLYLMLKDDLRTSDDLKQSKYFKESNLEYLKTFGDEFKAAVILLGSFFGYKKIYDLYYEKLNLSFFKAYKPVVNIANNTQSSIDVVEETIKTETQEIEATNDESTLNEVIKVEQTSKNEIQLIKNETITENTITEKAATEENLLLNQKFNIEEFILDILKRQTQITLTDLAEKIKVEKNDKKKRTNTELEKEISILVSLEVTKKAPKQVRLRTDLFGNTNTEKMASS